MSLITLEIKLKDGTKLSGTYTIYEALARLQFAAIKEDFESFTFGDVA